MFLVMGLASLLWLVLWRRSIAHRARNRARLSTNGDDPPYMLILRQRALWGGMMGTFCSNYAFYFVFSWLPLYLVHERGLSLAEMTPVASTRCSTCSMARAYCLTGGCSTVGLHAARASIAPIRQRLVSQQRRTSGLPDYEQRMVTGPGRRTP